MGIFSVFCRLIGGKSDRVVVQWNKMGSDKNK